MIINKTKLAHSLTILFAAVLAGVLFVVFASAVKAHLFPHSTTMRLNPDPQSGRDIPAYIKSDLQNCRAAQPHKSPGTVQWISPNNPSRYGSSNVTVPYGTTSLRLRYHRSGAVCWSTSGVYGMKYHILGARAFKPGSSTPGPSSEIVFYSGQTDQFLNWGTNPASYQSVGNYKTDNFYFDYRPVGGFVRSGNYRFEMDTIAINRFNNGVYLCVGGAEPRTTSYNNIAPCRSGPTYIGWNLNITISPPIPWRLENQYPASNPVPSEISAYPGQTYSLNYGVTNTGSGATTAGSGGVVDTRRVVTDSMPGLPGSATILNNQSIGAGATQARTESFTIPASAALGDRYCVLYEWQPIAGNTGVEVTNNGTLRTRETCYVVNDFRYLKVHGSDVWAGGDFDTLAQCQAIPSRDPAATSAARLGVRSSAVDGIGSSAQYGVAAIRNLTSNIDGLVEDFASGIVGDANVFSGSDVHTRQTFTNRDGVSALGNFSPGRCIPDYYEALGGDTVTASGAAPLIGAYGAPDLRRFTGPTLPGSTNVQKRAVIIKRGDLFISSNITYNGSPNPTYSVDPATGNPQAPSVVVIVKGGDINIGPGVTELDGLYMAIPDDTGTGGNINTCSTGVGVCPNKLTIRGSFIAKYVNFDRTSGGFQTTLLSGGISNQTQYASEVFEFSPELYLARPFEGLLELGGGVNDTENFTELPPVY